MIYVDEEVVKVGGVVLPGVFKGLEITGDAIVDEEKVEGQSKSKKQIRGYEDPKVTLEMTLEDTPTKTRFDQLAVIDSIFRTPGGGWPMVFPIVSKQTSIRGIQYVVFKTFTSKEANTSDRLTVTMNFLAFDEVIVKAMLNTTGSSKPATQTASTKRAVTSSGKGRAEKQKNKAAKSPAVDSQVMAQAALKAVRSLPIGGAT